jgi:uncharacterized membrane protein
MKWFFTPWGIIAGSAIILIIAVSIYYLVNGTATLAGAIAIALIVLALVTVVAMKIHDHKVKKAAQVDEFFARRSGSQAA